MSESRKSKRFDVIDNKLEGKKGNASDSEVNILRTIHGYTYPAPKQRHTLKRKRPEEVMLREKMPSREKWFEPLETTIENRIKYAQDIDKRWEPLGKPEIVQISANQWQCIQHKNNLPQQLRNTEIITVERNSPNSYKELSREEFEMDLATAELCEDKLKGFRLKHSIRFTNTASSLVEEYQKAVDKLGDAITAEQMTDLDNKYQKKLGEAREKCEKAIKALDDIYKNQKLDSQTLADLEQMEAKEANEIDLSRRVKSVESKIAKNPEELRKNAQSIQENLDKMGTLLQEIGPKIDSSIQAISQHSNADVISTLRENLAKDNISPDVFSHIAELNRRFQHYASLAPHDEASQDKMATLLDAHQATYLLFKKREIYLDEQQMLPLKYERYIRNQDAEAMFYNNRLLEHNKKIAKISGQLAAAQTEHAYSVAEADRIYKVLKTGGEPRPLANVHPSSTHEQTSADRFLKAQRRVDQTHLNVQSLEKKLAKSQEQEKELQMQVDLANGRYGTNQARETLKRDAIHEFDKLTIQNKRKTYEERVNNQIKLELLAINALLLKMHAKNMFKAAALADFMPMFPNTMQKEATNQMNVLQNFMRGL